MSTQQVLATSQGFMRAQSASYIPAQAGLFHDRVTQTHLELAVILLPQHLQ